MISGMGRERSDRRVVARSDREVGRSVVTPRVFRVRKRRPRPRALGLALTGEPLPAEKAALFHDNAVRIYRLQEDAQAL